MTEKAALPSPGSRLQKLKRVALRALLVVLALVLVAIVVENRLEARDREQLTQGETFADVRGASIRYRKVASKSDAPLVVFVNGLVGTREQWEGLQDEVASFAPSLAYDRGGSGFSLDGWAHDASEQADELFALLAELKYDGPVVIVSYSLSGPIAYMLMDKYPERLAGVVLLEATMPDFDKYNPSIRSPTRDLARTVISGNVTALLGLRRLIVRAKTPVPELLRDRRVDAILVSHPHWYSIMREWMAWSKSRQQALAAKIPEDLPLAVLGGPSWAKALGDDVRKNLSSSLLSRTSRGSYVPLDEPDHAKLLSSAIVRKQLIDAIRKMVDEPR